MALFVASRPVVWVVSWLAISGGACLLEDQRRSTHAASSASQTLRLISRERIVVHGPRTGWRYEFTSERPVQVVAVSDAEWLVATGLFRRT